MAYPSVPRRALANTREYTSSLRASGQAGRDRGEDLHTPPPQREGGRHLRGGSASGLPAAAAAIPGTCTGMTRFLLRNVAVSDERTTGRSPPHRGQSSAPREAGRRAGLAMEPPSAPSGRRHRRPPCLRAARRRLAASCLPWSIRLDIATSQTSWRGPDQTWDSPSLALRPHESGQGGRGAARPPRGEAAARQGRSPLRRRGESAVDAGDFARPEKAWPGQGTPARIWRGLPQRPSSSPTGPESLSSPSATAYVPQSAWLRRKVCRTRSGRNHLSARGSWP